jgi:3-oxoadipate enol-lactonase
MQSRSSGFAVAALLLGAWGCEGSRRGAAPVDTTAAESGTASVNGTTLAYEIRGSGPVVVLVHGGGFDSRLWDGQVEPLARHFRVLRYDVRGSGRSVDADTGRFQHHEDLAALLQHLGIARASIVGQSLGGRIAFDLALSHPGLVEDIVAVGPGVSGWPWARSDFGPWLAAFSEALAANDTAGAVDAWLESGYMAAAAQQPELRALLIRQAGENARAWFQRAEEPELDPPAMARLGDVKAPTLVIVGSRDERVILRVTDSLLAGVPGARREVIDGAGHAPNLEQPRRFNELMLDFLVRDRQ